MGRYAVNINGICIWAVEGNQIKMSTVGAIFLYLFFMSQTKKYTV